MTTYNSQSKNITGLDLFCVKIIVNIITGDHDAIILPT
jgi:hypothetical protein